MKEYKWFFLILALAVSACKSSSTEELVGNWTHRGDFPGSGRAFAACFTIGSKGYVSCGFNGVVRRVDTYEYDNATSGWKRVADFGGLARQQAVGFSLNGKGYVGTGWDGKDSIMRDFWEYDPASDSWREVASLPLIARERHSAVAFSLKVGDKEYGYVGTGFTDGKDQEVLKDFWRYDAGTDTWEQVLDFDGTKRYGATTFVIGNKAYLCAGINTGSILSSDFWMFDPNGTSLWTQKRKIITSNPDEDYDDDYLSNITRAYGVAFTMPVSGEIRAHLTLGSGGSSSTSVWEYDPVLDLWKRRTTFVNNSSPKTREGAVAFSFPEGNVLVGMGRSGTQYNSDLYQFTPLVEDNVYDD